MCCAVFHTVLSKVASQFSHTREKARGRLVRLGVLCFASCCAGQSAQLTASWSESVAAVSITAAPH